MGVTKVTLRKRLLPSGKITLYLDFYPPLRDPHSRKYVRHEYLGIYLVNKPRFQSDKDANKEKIAQAEAIRSERELAIIRGQYDFLDKTKLKMDFLAYFKTKLDTKDRIALAMIEDAEKSGILREGATIVEPTSGNTGVGLAWVGAAKGYKVILTMPDTMSQERRSLLRALGATLVLTPGAEGMKGAIAKAEAIRAETPGAVILGQFVNPANPAAHERTTGEEIWADTKGNVDIFVAGVGTGGTVSGTGKALKKHNPTVQVVAVEPASSAVLSTGVAGKHKIQGIGAGFVPKTYSAETVDRILPVADDAAIAASRLLAAKEGLLVGISSGAAFAAAMELSRQSENEGKTIVALLPDTGERYLSTILFDFDNYPL